MAVFQYRAVDSAGKVAEGVMEAEAERGVVSRLHEMGFVPLGITSSGGVARRRAESPAAFLKRRKITEKDLLYFTQELRTLVGAGLPLDRSLSVLANLVQGEEMKRTSRSLLEGVRAGRPLSSAMAEEPDIFPKVYINMIRAGESSGVMEGTLRYLADYLERSLNFKEELKSALTYPSLVAFIAALSLIILFVYVIPKFSLLFQDVRSALPWTTVLLLQFSKGLSRYGWVMLVLAVLGGLGLNFYIRSPEGRLQWDRWRLQAWVLGELFRQMEVARFARTLAVLLKGGVPILEALGTAQGVVGNQVLAQALAQVQIRVREGKSMAAPLAESGVFPVLALQMIAVGEETGKLEGMLASVADHYDQEVKRTTQRLVSLLQPALILGMGLVVGVVVVSMLAAIFSIYDLPF